MRSAAKIVLVVTLAWSIPACTLVGGGAGFAIGSLRQPDPSTPDVVRTQRTADGQQAIVPKPMSVAGHTLIGGLGGLVIDLLVFSLFISGGGGSDITIGS